MTLISLIVVAFIVGGLTGGVLTAAVYEHRESEAEEPPEQGGREPFTGHVPSVWAPSNEDGGRP